MKEIGIRKVLGASVQSITTLLSKDFIRLTNAEFIAELDLVMKMSPGRLSNAKSPSGFEDETIACVRDFCEEYGLAASDVMAVRGPSLGPGKSEFTNYDKEFGSRFDRWRTEGTDLVNLWRMTRDQLVSAGLRPENLFSLDLCTETLANLFFSYRREKTCGRQASLIWIKE